MLKIVCINERNGRRAFCASPAAVCPVFILQDFSVAFYYFFVPEEGIFPFPGHVSRAVVVFIYEDQTVAFFDFSGGGADHVGAAPARVADQVHAVAYGFFHFLNMLPHIIDAVIVMDLSVLCDLVHCAKAVLHDHDRHLIPVIDLIQHVAKAQSIDLPPPVGCFEIRILDIYRAVSFCGLGILLCKADAIAGIVADADEVNGAVFQDFRVFLVKFS